MQKIVMDVTYIKHNGKWHYLAGYLDLFNNEIVELELSDAFDNFLVMRPAERLLKRQMSTEHQVLLHSGQGVQYSSAGYCSLLKEYNVFKACQEPETLATTRLWKAFGEDSTTHCENISAAGSITISGQPLNVLSTISITNVLFAS